MDELMTDLGDVVMQVHTIKFIVKILFLTMLGNFVWVFSGLYKIRKNQEKILKKLYPEDEKKKDTP